MLPGKRGVAVRGGGPKEVSQGKKWPTLASPNTQIPSNKKLKKYPKTIIKDRIKLRILLNVF